MPRLLNTAIGASPRVATAKMPAPHALAQLWSSDAAGSMRVHRDVKKAGRDQVFVAAAGRCAKTRFGPGQDFNDVGLGGIGEAKVGHQFYARTFLLARVPS